LSKEDVKVSVEREFDEEFFYKDNIFKILTPVKLEKADEFGIIFKKALMLFYSPSGVGKSYTLAFLASKTKLKTYYVDLEENPSGLDRFCEKIGVNYVGAVDAATVMSDLLNSKMDMDNVFFIFDSYSYFVQEANANNNATDTAKTVRQGLALSRELGATVAFIDHATKQSGDIEKFKIEGNASGKTKPLDILYKIDRKDKKDWQSPVTLTVEKTRVEGLKMFKTFEVDSYNRSVGEEIVEPVWKKNKKEFPDVG